MHTVLVSFEENLMEMKEAGEESNFSLFVIFLRRKRNGNEEKVNFTFFSKNYQQWKDLQRK